VRHTYALEYGTDTIEVQADAIEKGKRVVLVDDLLATGGTMAAAVTLLEQVGAVVPAAACVIELTFLEGRKRLPTQASWRSGAGGRTRWPRACGWRNRPVPRSCGGGAGTTRFGDESVEHGIQLRGIDGLGEETIHPGVFASLHSGLKRIGCQRDDRRAAPAAL